MKKIGLLSDTHGYLDPKIFNCFGNCDEIWHAGDIGDPSVSEQLRNFKPLRAVYGNIDSQNIRAMHPADLSFSCEEITVFMTHIGGNPGHYSPGIKEKINQIRPGLFICGHSHILKVMRDTTYNMLFINPGAAGKSGFHKIKTMVRFDINGNRIENLDVIELGLRGAIE